MSRASCAAAAALALAACHGEYQPVDPALRVVGGPLSVAEGGGTATFEIALTTAPQAPVDVDVLAEDATEGLVVGPAGGEPGAWAQLRFTPADWSTPQAVTVTGVDDALRDGDVGWRVLLLVAGSEDAAWAAAPGAAISVVTEDDDTPGIRLGRTALRTAESGGTTDGFTVALASQPAGVVTIQVWSVDPTEGLVSGGPHAISPGAAMDLVFTPSGWSTPQAVTVTSRDDDEVDGDQVYAVVVGAASGDPDYAALASQQVTVVNADTDVAEVILWLGATSFAEGSGTGIGVQLASRPAEPVRIPVACGDPAVAWLSSPNASTEDGTALTLAFDPSNWSIPQTVQIWGKQDDVVDGPQALAISLGPPVGDPVYAALPQQVVDLTVLDAQVAGIAAWSAGSLALTEGGSVELDVSLVAAPLADVTVPVASSDPAEALVSAGGSAPAPSVALTFTPASWAVAQRVTVSAVDDALLELDPPHPFTIAVGPATGPRAWDGVVGRTFAGSTADDEAAGDEGTLAAPVELTGRLPWAGRVGRGSSWYRLTGFPEGGIVSLTGATLAAVRLAALDDTPAHAALCGPRPAASSTACAVRLPPGGSFLVQVDGSATARGTPFTLDAAPFTFSGDAPKAIPDGGPLVLSDLGLSGVPPGYAGVALFVEIAHPRAADLQIFLRPPPGTGAYQQAGCSPGDGPDWDRTVFFDDGALPYVCDATAPFAGAFRPATFLPHPDPSAVNGTWTLDVRDVVAGNAGTIVRWGLAVR